MASKYVAPFRTGAKNDLNDAVAICTAVIRTSTRFVRIKSADQQAILLLHRARDHWVHERTALLNQIRSMLAEFSIIAPKGRHVLQTAIPEGLEDGDNPISDLAKVIISDCFGDKTDRLSLWCQSLVEHRGFKRAIVALPAKNARII